MEEPHLTTVHSDPMGSAQAIHILVVAAVAGRIRHILLAWEVVAVDSNQACHRVAGVAQGTCHMLRRQQQQEVGEEVGGCLFP